MAQLIAFGKVEFIDPEYLFFYRYDWIINGSDRFSRLEDSGFDNMTGAMRENTVTDPHPQSYGEE